jgi:hypothetical protein
LLKQTETLSKHWAMRRASGGRRCTLLVSGLRGLRHSSVEQARAIQVPRQALALWPASSPAWM